MNESTSKETRENLGVESAKSHNGKAVTSLVFGIIAIAFYFSLLGIISAAGAILLGIIARRGMAKSGNHKGTKKAGWGVGLGIAAIVIFSVHLILAVSAHRAVYELLESKPSLFTQNIASEERWPSAFVRRPETSVPTSIESQQPKLTEELAINMSQALGFWIGQQYSIDKLIEHFPQLRPQLILAKTNFDNKLGPAIKYMEQVLANQIPNWSQIRKEIVDTIVAQADFERLTYEEAQAYVTDVEKRTQGQIPSPLLETTLMFHPDYIRNPEREYLDGFTKEYRTDGTGKSRGVKIGIEYPGSWRAKEGRRPHVVQNIASQNGKGFESVMITIADDPDDLSEEDFLLLQAEEMCESFAPGTRTIDYGTVRIAGKQAIWGEFDLITQRVGMEMEVHGLIFTFLHKGNFVIIMFDAASSPAVAGGNAKERFDRYARLFQVMLNSVDFFGRYEGDY